MSSVRVSLSDRVSYRLSNQRRGQAASTSRTHLSLPRTSHTIIRQSFAAALLLFLLACGELRAGYDLVVGSLVTNSVVRYDGRTGALRGTLVAPQSGGLNYPIGVALGPSGADLFVCSALSNAVLRYDAQTGSFLGVFASGGGLLFPQSLVFGPDGNLYVGGTNGAVLRYDGVTGAFLGAFTTGGPINGAFGLVYGPDGNLYVSSFGNNMVLRYDGQSGAYLGVFASGNGISSPYGLTFGPDNNLYLVSSDPSSILRFNGQTGQFIDTFVQSGAGGMTSPVGIAFGPSGRLFVSSFVTHNVLMFSPDTGAFLGEFVPSSSGGLTGPTYFQFRHVCGRGDVNNDSHVDLNDLPIFIDVLLGVDLDPIHADEADTTCDGLVDGRDIPQFVSHILSD